MKPSCDCIEREYGRNNTHDMMIFWNAGTYWDEDEQRTERMTLFPNFCPQCGAPYKEDKE